MNAIYRFEQPVYASFNADVTLAEDNDNELRATLTTFGNKDSYGDIIDPGALDTWMKDNAGKDLPMLFGHDTKEIIGKWNGLEKMVRKFKAKGSLYKDFIARAGEVYGLLKASAIKGVSIGFKPLDYEFWEEKDDFGILWKEIELLEASIVLFPANNRAQVDQIKARHRQEMQVKRLERFDDQTLNELKRRLRK